MADEPHFPAPRAPGPVYREPAILPISAPIPLASRVQVHRPDAPRDSETLPPPSPQVDAPALARAFRQERTYWQRHRLFARYPRLIGAGLVGLGGWLVSTTLDVLHHGGYYGVRSTVAAPVLVLIGLWSLAFGYPLGESGRPPSWWVAGFASCAAIGVLIGMSLLGALWG